MRGRWTLALLALGLAACAPRLEVAVPTPEVTLPAPEVRPAVLPGNPLPFSDDFEGYPVGALLPLANPGAYRLWIHPGEEHNDIAYVAEAVGPQGRSEKAAVIRYPWGGGGGLAALVTGAEDWKNYRVEAVFKVQDDQWWVYANINGNGRHAYVLEVYGRDAKLYKQIGKERTVVARREISGPRDDGGWHKLVAECRQDGVRIAVDGEVLADYRDTDPAFAQGGFGLQASRFGRKFWISSWRFSPLVGAGQ